MADESGRANCDVDEPDSHNWAGTPALPHPFGKGILPQKSLKILREAADGLDALEFKLKLKDLPPKVRGVFGMSC